MALARYRDAASLAPDEPSAAILGDLLVADFEASRGHASASLASYRKALATWNQVSVVGPYDLVPRRFMVVAQVVEVERLARGPDADRALRASWLLEHDRPADALAATPSKDLAHRARLALAVTLQRKGDPAALRAFSELAGEATGIVAHAANLARASLLLEKDPRIAWALARRTLVRWAAEPRREPTSALERDVTSIRDAVAVRCRKPFEVAVIPGQLETELSDGTLHLITVSRRLPGVERVVAIDGSDGRVTRQLVSRAFSEPFRRRSSHARAGRYQVLELDRCDTGAR